MPKMPHDDRLALLEDKMAELAFIAGATNKEEVTTPSKQDPSTSSQQNMIEQ